MAKQRKSRRKTPPIPNKKWPAVLGISLVVALLIVGLSAIYLRESPVAIADADIVVYKNPTCGCCTNWVDHLEANGFSVAVKNMNSIQPVQAKLGVPQALGSCHTAVVDNYWVEGHVPADLIQRLMTEQPKTIRGIAVPGMPIGSPGMEGPNPVEYEVIAYDSSGDTQVYATRQGRSTPD